MGVLLFVLSVLIPRPQFYADILAARTIAKTLYLRVLRATMKPGRPRAVGFPIRVSLVVLVVFFTVFGGQFRVGFLLSRLWATHPLAMPTYFTSMLVVDPSITGRDSIELKPDILEHDSVCTSPASANSPLESLPTTYPDILHKYAKFHEEGRACLDALAKGKPLPRVADPEFCQRPRVLVFLNQGRKSGLGDTGRGIMYAFLVAVATRRLFFIPGLADSTSHFPLSAALIPAVIDWRISPSAHKYIHDERYRNSAFIRTIRTRTDFRYKLSRTELYLKSEDGFIDDDARTPFHDLFEPFSVVHFFPRIPRGSLYPFTKLLLPKEFGIHSHLLESTDLDVLLTRMLFKPSVVVDYFAKNLAFPEDGNDYVSVHLRTGLDTGETIDRRFGDSGSHLERVAKLTFWCLRNVTTDEQRNVFVASDSMQLKKAMVNIAPQFNARIATSFEQAIHTSTILRSSQKHSSANLRQVEACKGYMNAVIDIVTLSKSSVLIAAPSTFADFAFNLGQFETFRMLPIKQIEQSESVTCRDNRLYGESRS